VSEERGGQSVTRTRPRQRSDSLLSHATLQLAARITTAGGQLAAVWLVGAIGSDALLAPYVVAVSAAGLVATAIDGGSGLWVVRVLAEGRPVPKLVKPRMMVLVVCTVVLFACASAIGLGYDSVPWVLAAGSLLGCSTLWRGVLWSRFAFSREYLAATIQTGVLLLGLGVLALEAKPAVWHPLAAMAVANGIGYGVRRRSAIRFVDIDQSALGFGQWLRAAYSYAGQSAVTSAQSQADVLLLGALWSGGAGGVAAYGLAMRIYYALGMPFEALGASLLPRIAQQKRISVRTLLYSGVPLALAGVLAMAVVSSYGGLFGLSADGAAHLGNIGRILAIALPFRFACYVLGAVVTGSGRQSARFRAAALGLVAMIGLDVLLIPGHGPVGASLALLTGDVVLLSGYARAAYVAIRGKQVR